jgi:hypothetical protein
LAVADNDTMGIENMLQQMDSVNLTLDLTLADQVKPKKPTPFQKQGTQKRGGGGGFKQYR